MIPFAVEEWIRHRPYEKLWWSAPVFVVVLLWALLGISLIAWSPTRAKARYAETASQALEAKDYRTARLAYERLLGSGKEPRVEDLFSLSLALAGLGDARDATVLLRLAAPSDRPSLAPAHLQAAQSLLSQTNSSPALIREAVTQLKLALALDPHSAEAGDMLGWLYYQARDWAKAKPHLQEVASRRPRAMLLLAYIAQRERDYTDMRIKANRAIAGYREKLNRAGGLSLSDRSCWAQALTLLGDYSEAIKVMESNAGRSPGKESTQAMAEVYGEWVRHVVESQPTNLLLRVQLIQQGLAHNRWSTTLLQHLVLASQSECEGAKEAKETLSRLLAEPELRGILHFMLGTEEWKKGKIEEAKKHFSIAFDAAPHLPHVANNLAALLAICKEPDLPRALGIIQPLVEKYPNQPNFRDTRGQILAKMGKWERAICDLEYALPSLQSKAATHTALAEAYLGLGMKDLAKQHEILAREAEKTESETNQSQ